MPCRRVCTYEEQEAERLPACLPACLRRFHGSGGRRCAGAEPLLSGHLGSHIWKGARNPSRSQPPNPYQKEKKKSNNFQVEEYDGLAAERAVTVGSVQEETGSSG